jgi:hypothetical protein
MLIIHLIVLFTQLINKLGECLKIHHFIFLFPFLENIDLISIQSVNKNNDNRFAITVRVITIGLSLITKDHLYYCVIITNRRFRYDVLSLQILLIS